jgi:hypothetical protein
MGLPLTEKYYKRDREKLLNKREYHDKGKENSVFDVDNNVTISKYIGKRSLHSAEIGKDVNQRRKVSAERDSYEQYIPTAKNQRPIQNNKAGICRYPPSAGSSARSKVSFVQLDDDEDASSGDSDSDEETFDIESNKNYDKNIYETTIDDRISRESAAYKIVADQTLGQISLKRKEDRTFDLKTDFDDENNAKTFRANEVKSGLSQSGHDLSINEGQSESPGHSTTARFYTESLFSDDDW